MIQFEAMGRRKASSPVHARGNAVIANLLNTIIPTEQNVYRTMPPTISSLSNLAEGVALAPGIFGGGNTVGCGWLNVKNGALVG